MAQNPYANPDTKGVGAPPPPNYNTSSPYPPQNDLFNFLRSLNLDSYYTSFTQAQVTDMETLARLKNDDLKEIGLPVGPRRTILDEIEKRNPSNNNFNNFNNFNPDLNNNYQYNTNTHGTSTQVYGNVSAPEPPSNTLMNNNNINNINNNNTQNNNNISNNNNRPSGIMDNTTRPWFYFIFGMAFSLPFPFFCFGMVFHFMGHTRHYKFDNDENTFDFDQFRGMCCYCLDVEETSLNYSDLKCFKVEINPNMRVNEQPCGEIKLMTHDGRSFELSSGMSTIWSAQQEAQKLSQFTGIPVEGSGGFTRAAIMF